MKIMFKKIKNYFNFNIFKQSRRYITYILLTIMSLSLTINLPINAQNPLGINTDKAPVVVDGKVLFEVGNTGNFIGVI